MNYQTLVFSGLTLLFLSGCGNTTEKKEIIGDAEKQLLDDSVKSNLPTLDTVKTTYPVQIGNDMGLISIVKVSSNKPSHFIIDLDYRNEKVFSIYVDKQVLIDSTVRPMFLDTLHLDYTLGATLASVKYKAIRGSTLNFSAVLVNEEQQKQVEGRFNVFYNPARKGKVYGWITDTVYDKVSIK
jgi:hypothetical protein